MNLVTFLNKPKFDQYLLKRKILRTQIPSEFQISSKKLSQFSPFLLAKQASSFQSEYYHAGEFFVLHYLSLYNLICIIVREINNSQLARIRYTNLTLLRIINHSINKMCLTLRKKNTRGFDKCLKTS